MNKTLKYHNENGTSSTPFKMLGEVDQENIRSGFADSAKPQSDDFTKADFEDALKKTSYQRAIPE